MRLIHNNISWVFCDHFYQWSVFFKNYLLKAGSDTSWGEGHVDKGSP